MALFTFTLDRHFLVAHCRCLFVNKRVTLPDHMARFMSILSIPWPEGRGKVKFDYKQYTIFVYHVYRFDWNWNFTSVKVEWTNTLDSRYMLGLNLIRTKIFGSLTLNFFFIKAYLLLVISASHFMYIKVKGFGQLSVSCHTDHDDFFTHFYKKGFCISFIIYLNFWSKLDFIIIIS